MHPKDILIDQFDYHLPDSRIASHPLECRDACKLLVWKQGEEPQETVFNQLPSLLPDGSVLVYNNTRVINARLRFRKSTGAVIEIFCLEPAIPADYARNFESTGYCSWVCLVGNSKRWKEGAVETTVQVGEKAVNLKATRSEAMGNSWKIDFEWDGGVSFAEVIAAAGQIPIPPYLNRATEQSDSEDYQTVYSHIDGSVAAPTAGLHFTPELLDEISSRGIPRLEVTLHVGAGTFQPVKSDAIGDHPMHREYIAVATDVIRLLATAAATGSVIAVGTTSVRTIESLYHIGCLIHAGQWTGEVPQWYPYQESHPQLSASEALTILADTLEADGQRALIAATRIIIAPGYDYKVVKGMVTNFHQPRSTLLLLVSAFMGGDLWRDIYDFALARDFRFLSYGDACLLLR